MNFLTEEDMVEFAAFLIEEYSIPFQRVQMGTTETNVDFTLGVRTNRPNINTLAYGEVENTKIRNMNVSFLIHGNAKERETEYVANKLFIQLEKLKSGFYCDDIPIVKLSLDFERPQPLGMDDKKVYEYIIDFSIKYRCD